MRSIFRVLVTVTIFATALFWAMPFIDFMWYSNEQLILLDQNGLGSSITASYTLYWFQLGLWVLVSVGLFLFVKLARTAFVALYLVNSFAALFYGIQVLTPIEVFLSNFIGLADGAIIALMYFTSISEEFRESS